MSLPHMTNNEFIAVPKATDTELGHYIPNMSWMWVACGTLFVIK